MSGRPWDLNRDMRVTGHGYLPIGGVLVGAELLIMQPVRDAASIKM